jgi:hypothetical protein
MFFIHPHNQYTSTKKPASKLHTSTNIYSRIFAEKKNPMSTSEGSGLTLAQNEFLSSSRNLKKSKERHNIISVFYIRDVFLYLLLANASSAGFVIKFDDFDKCGVTILLFFFLLRLFLKLLFGGVVGLLTFV